MNPELLKKCLSGNASDVEWAAYLSWINGDGADDDLEDLGDDSQLIKGRIFTKVIEKNEKQQLGKRRKTIALATGIAASLFCLFCFAFLYQSDHKFQQAQVFRYKANAEPSANNFNGIVVQLAKNSEVSLNQRTNTNISLHFLGSVMLSNNSTQDQNITIQHNRDGLKKICLRKGHSYFLSYLNFKYQEVIMVDKQHMNDIPPALAMNMQQEFNL